ncbi:hypothetical protein JJQ72_09295 [Paenibacillus sp. F411]|uniref:hypothetical protein n=1 Tax=Paenibacillus sp. F411 TaxID=2820239 RepID=UPI001AAFE664|nr:hypothetical protein [Paenibacillus sp. F411]MBO2944160.1 hypothetical protein [Paenibacillus sp. F411]
MVNKVMNSIKFDLMILLRRWFFWISFILLIIGLLYIVWFRLVSGDAGGALTSSAAVVQIGMLYFSIIGFYMVRQDNTNQMSELVNTISMGYLHKFISKFVCVVFLIVGYALLSLSIILLFFNRFGVPFEMYIKTVLYIMLYYVLPFWISAWLGCLLGGSGKFKASLLGLLLFNIFAGPMNTLILTNLMAVLNINLYPLLSILNLGQSDIHLLYDPIYGFPLELNRWLIKLQWLALLVIMIILKLKMKQEIKMPSAIGGVIVCMALIIINQYIILQPSQVIHTLSEKDSKELYDKNFYSEMVVDQKAKEPIEFQVQSYQVKLDVKRSLQVQADLDLRMGKNVDKLTFSLYHNFHIEHIQDETGNNLQFHRNQDRLEIILAKNVVKGESVHLRITYSGISSPYFYANEQAVLLPAYFNWLPSPGYYPSMINQDGYRLVQVPSSLIDTPISYELRYSGDKHIFTNLTQSSPGIWKGETSSGITVVAGMVKSQRMDQMTVFDSLSNYKAEESIRNYIDAIQQIRPKILDDFGIQKPQLTKIFFLPLPIEAAKVFKSTWDLGDYWIVSTQSHLNHDILNYEALNVAGITSSLLRSPEISMNAANEDLMLVAYEHWYYLQHNIDEKSSLARFVDYGYIDPEFKLWIEKNSEYQEEMRTFFRHWLVMIEKGANERQIKQFIADKMEEGRV